MGITILVGSFHTLCEELEFMRKASTIKREPFHKFSRRFLRRIRKSIVCTPLIERILTRFTSPSPVGLL